MSEIKVEKRETVYDFTESVVFIAHGSDWCSNLANIDLGRP